MDGTTLVWSDNATNQGFQTETPTVVGSKFSTETPTIVASKFSNASAQETSRSKIPMWIYPLLAFLIGLIFILGIVAVYALMNIGGDESASKDGNTNIEKSNSTEDDSDGQTPNISIGENTEETPEKTPKKTPKPTPQKTPDDELIVEKPKQPKVYGTTRIKFAKGAVSSRVSGGIDSKSRRSFVLKASAGQYLSANVSSSNNCVVFDNDSRAIGFTTGSGDNQIVIYNDCESTNFSVTVAIR